MINKIQPIFIMAFVLLFMASCLNNDEEEVTYYDDTAITSFTLGTLKKVVHTTSSKGADSTYTTTYSASSTPFYIDQVSASIYNPDSLPKGIDAKHILCTIGSKNGGTVVLQLKSKSGADSLAYYSSSDSIDFSEPVKMRVYSLRGTSYRTYTIKVNIHQQDGTEMSWNSSSVSALSTVGDRKLVALNGQLYLFGSLGSQTVGYVQQDGAWQPLTPTTTLGADAWKSVAAMGSYLYVLSDGCVMRSADGNAWQLMGQNSALTQLAGASDSRLYALTATGLMVSKDSGATWTAEEIDDRADLLPTDDLSFICKTHSINANTYKLILLGTRDGHARIWSKVEENDDDAQDQPWSYYTPTSDNPSQLPYLANLQAVQYGDYLVATGGDFTTFYSSQDEGLTWFADTLYNLPATFDFKAGQFSMIRSGSHLYLSQSGSALVWQGLLAREAWATDQKKFTE